MRPGRTTADAPSLKAVEKVVSEKLDMTALVNSSTVTVERHQAKSQIKIHNTKVTVA